MDQRKLMDNANTITDMAKVCIVYLKKLFFINIVITFCSFMQLILITRTLISFNIQ